MNPLQLLIGSSMAYTQRIGAFEVFAFTVRSKQFSTQFDWYETPHTTNCLVGIRHKVGVTLLTGIPVVASLAES